MDDKSGVIASSQKHHENQARLLLKQQMNGTIADEYHQNIVASKVLCYMSRIKQYRNFNFDFYINWARV